ncbi:hypothetical protein [Streptomyces sp. NPDC056160]
MRWHEALTGQDGHRTPRRHRGGPHRTKACASRGVTGVAAVRP